jgi:anti-sigma regulatory factor (Ser/Thr protein kinase)
MAKTRRDLLSITAAAAAVGLSVSRLRRMADAGRVPVEFTAGGHRRFRLPELRAALASGIRAPLDTTDDLGPPTWSKRLSLAGLREEDVWREAIEAIGLAKGVGAYQVFHYALTEIVNNAIDHSAGTSVEVRAWSDPVAFEVADDGVGALERVRATFGLESPLEAVVELSKGKATSDPSKHTGQGIFFTSKALDLFRIEANGFAWTVDNVSGDEAIGISTRRTGTRVTGRVSRDTRRTMADVFRPFTGGEGGFSRTRPAVRLVDTGLSFVSRSEAKILVGRLEQFEEVELDFAGVDEVGQGFVDEVFRVWPLRHPGTRLTPVNMNPAVEFMVRRGLSE